jgi:arylsulfatase A
MDRRGFLKAAGLGAASLVAPNCTAAPRRQFATRRMRRKPNIVFILVDDMGWPDVACYGSKFHETPNIDRLARQGMKFSDAYAACPVCSPTRASIMAGQSQEDRDRLVSRRRASRAK